MSTLQVNQLKHTDDSFVLPEFSYTFESGKLYGILSSSDEQISVFLKLLAGIIEPQSGEVLLEDKNLNIGNLFDIRPLRKKISFIFERGSLLANLNIRENLLLPFDYHYPELEQSVKLEKIAEHFQYFQLSESILDLRPAAIREETTKLIVIIRALLTEPECLFLDMPFTDLEMRNKKRLIQKIIEMRAGGKTTQIFYSNTDILYDRCDDCLVVSKGKILFTGLWDEILLQDSPDIQKIIKDYFEIGLDEA